MKFSGEELEQFFKELKKEHDKNTEWLIQRGWKKTEEYHAEPNRSLKSNVWVSPKGKRAVHTIDLIAFKHLPQAIDVATRDFLEEKGWKKVTIVKKTPLLDETQRWCHYLHPTSNKVYSFLEAEDIARFNNNDDSLAEECLSPLTNRLNEDLKDIQVEEENEIHIHFAEGASNWTFEKIVKT